MMVLLVLILIILWFIGNLLADIKSELKKNNNLLEKQNQIIKNKM